MPSKFSDREWSHPSDTLRLRADPMELPGTASSPVVVDAVPGSRKTSA